MAISSLISKIRSAYNTNIFEESSYRDSLYLYQIRIIPSSSRTSSTVNPPTIEGLLTKPLNFSVEAAWDTLGYEGLLNSLPGLIRKSIDYTMVPLTVGGYGVNNIGLVTKKYYKQSGYLKISPSFRVVDWEGTGQPLKNAQMLVNSCIPLRIKSVCIENLQNKINNALLDALKNETVLSKFYEYAKKAGGLLLDKLNEISALVSKTAVGDIEGQKLIAKATQEWIQSADAINLTSAPTPVMVEIGNYFSYEPMVIENVSVNFSEQLTKAGPLYADFTVDLSSQEVISIGNIGLMNKSQNRVE